MPIVADMRTSKIAVDRSGWLCSIQLQDDVINETICLANLEDKTFDKDNTPLQTSLKKRFRQVYIQPNIRSFFQQTINFMLSVYLDLFIYIFIGTTSITICVTLPGISWVKVQGPRLGVLTKPMSSLTPTACLNIMRPFI
uniref:Uncharacterized protein n=1 Tax=Glossina palpalis gambiensis TaxID=67801 RepID=A0A1B0BA20_9MUSC